MMEVVIVDDGNRLTVYELVERVIPCIIAKHYSENYIQGFRSTFRNLLAYCNKNEKKYFTAELAQQFMLDCYGVQPGTVERRCSRVHRAMDLLSDYQHFNAVMLRRRLNREFPAGLQEGAVNYLQKLSLHGRRENTLRSHRNVLLRFTDYLFSVGVTDYKLLSADIVNRYVKVVSCNYSNSVVRLHYSILLRFFQYLAHSGYKETDLSLKMMPIVKVSTSARIPTTLDLSQIESILASVDRESPQGKRDYAVLMIAVKLGIRTSDIRNLRPANFNWEQHLVSFTQVKTGEPITLPLPTDVGWAVIDYLKNGRPVSDAPEIFLRAVAPYVSLQNFDNILIKHMRKAGIPLDSIKHHGLHSLRHSLATHMIAKQIRRYQQELDDAKAEYAALQNARLNEAAEIRKLRTYYDEFRGWAEEFDAAPLEIKRMILSQLIERVEVGRKYQVTIKLNMEYQQFLEITEEQKLIPLISA